MFLSDDDMVECPYNKTHRMLRKRLQSHLLKCRLSYPDVELRKCPFNITHLIPEPEFTHHATNCPDRKLITQYKYDAPEQKGEEVPKHAPIECDENWDDTDVNDYNPQLYLERANIIRKPDGANRSERKLFIKKERKRLGDGDESSDEDNSFVLPPGNKRRQRDDSKETGARNKRSTSPSTSSYFKERSRSPTNTSNRSRSRSPTNKSNRSRSRSPAGSRRSPNYSRPYSPISNSDQDPYNNGCGRNVNNNQYNSGRDPYYSNENNSQAYYDRNTETNPVMPQAPPPPMISYPTPRSYILKKPSASDH